MTNEQHKILVTVASYMRDWFKREIRPSFVFHNFHHIQKVVDDVVKLAQKEGVTEEEQEVLSLAAWFQYVGLVQTKEQYHEQSAAFASSYLSAEKYDKKKTDQVAQLILKSNGKPETQLEKIFHDARYLFLGRKKFLSTDAPLLRLEEESMLGKRFTEKQWSDYLIKLLLHHNYYTRWADKKYGKRKLKYIAEQKTKGIKAREKTLKKKTGKNMGRGIDTLYRTGFRNHTNLSQIADGKANMMISINTIVLSILITISGAGLSLLEDFFSNGFSYTLPILILLLSSLTALVFAVFSAKPTITAYDLKTDRTFPDDLNMLYFGNFLQIDKEQFVSYLSELKNDQNRLYEDLGRDLYNLGLVLRKKYYLLSISYNIFVGGLVLSVLSFIAIYLI